MSILLDRFHTKFARHPWRGSGFDNPAQRSARYTYLSVMLYAAVRPSKLLRRLAASSSRSLPRANLGRLIFTHDTLDWMQIPDQPHGHSRRWLKTHSLRLNFLGCSNASRCRIVHLQAANPIGRHLRSSLASNGQTGGLRGFAIMRLRVCALKGRPGC